jgi:hypothetical protein
MPRLINQVIDAFVNEFDTLFPEGMVKERAVCCVGAQHAINAAKKHHQMIRKGLPSTFEHTEGLDPQKYAELREVPDINDAYCSGYNTAVDFITAQMDWG